MVAIVYENSASVERFNEAGATKPRNAEDPVTRHLFLPRFNEAGATKPRNVVTFWHQLAGKKGLQ